MACVYRIRCTESGKFYIGSAIDAGNRWRAHRYQLCKGSHHSPGLQAAWRKYGSAAFIFEIIEDGIEDGDVVSREQHWLDALNPFGSRGYNACRTAGSCLGVRHSKRTRKRVSSGVKAGWSDRKTRQKRVDGIKAAASRPEVKARRREISKAVSSSPEWRAEKSAAIKRAWSRPGYREKQSEALKSMWNDPAVKAKHAAAVSEGSRRAWADPVKKAERLRKSLAKRRETIAAKKAAGTYAHSSAGGLATAVVWADPERRESMLAKMKSTIAAKKAAGCYKPNTAGADAMRKMWRDPRRREAINAARNAVMSDPSVKAKRAAGVAAFWADPVRRAAWIAKQRATRAAKEAAKNG